MGDLDRDVTLRVNLDTQGAETRIGQLNNAIKRTGDVGASSATAVSAGWGSIDPVFARLNERVQSFGDRFQNTGLLGQRYIAGIGLTLKELEKEYGHNIQAADALSEAEKRIFASSQAAYKEAISEQRAYNEQLMEVGRATRHFTTLEGALLSLGGKTGQATILVAGFIAAWEGGTKIGTKLREMIISLLPEFDAMSRKWSDVVADMMNVWTDFAHGIIRQVPTKELQDLLTPLTARGAQQQFSMNLDQGMKSLGLTSLDQTTAEISKFRDQIIALQADGQGLTEFFKTNRAHMQTWVATLQGANKVVPEFITGILKGLEFLDKLEKDAKWVSQRQTVKDELANLTRNMQVDLAAGATYAHVLELNDTQILKLGKDAEFLNIKLTEQQQHWENDAKAAAAFQAGVKLNLFKQLSDDATKLGTFAGAVSIFGSDADIEKRRELLLKWQEEDNALKVRLDDAEHKKFLDNMRKAGEVLHKALEEFAGEVGNLFVGALEGGAAGFAQAAASLFAKQLKENVGAIFKDLATSAFGGIQQITPGMSKDEALNAAAQNQRTTNLVNGTLNLIALFSQLAASGAGVNNPRQQPIGTVLAGGIAGASAGISIGATGVLGLSSALGGVIGAIVGLIIGGLMLALAPAVGAGYPYAKFGVKAGGGAFFDPTQNVTDNERLDALQRLQAQYNKFWNGYVKILMDLPLNLPITMASLSTALYPTVGLNKPSGDVGGAASKDFWSQFANYINVGMPHDMADRFFGPISAGFEKLGLSAEAFKSIWDNLQTLDPTAVLTALSNLALGLTEIQKASAYFGLSGKGLLGEGFKDASKTFIDTLREGDEKMRKFADGIQFLVGTDKIDAMKQLGDLEAARMQQIKDFVNALAQAITQTEKSYQSLIRGLTLEGIQKGGKPDIQGQVEFLKKYADQLLGDIRGATSPQEVLALSQELQNTIMQIKALGGSVSPAAMEQFRKWAITNLEIAQKAVTDKLKSFADDLAKQNKLFTDAIQGFIDAFLHATAQLTGTAPDPTKVIIPPGTVPTGGRDTTDDRPFGGRGRGWRPRPGTDSPSGTGDTFYGYGQPGEGLWRPHFPWTRPTTPYGPLPGGHLTGEPGSMASLIAPALQQAFAAANREQIKILSDMVFKLEEQNRILREGSHVEVSGVIDVVDATGATVTQVPVDDGFERRTVNSRRMA